MRKPRALGGHGGSQLGVAGINYSACKWLADLDDPVESGDLLP
jgi:hypothetical protein